MELAMQLISTDQTVRDNTIQYLKDFNQQSLSTQAKKENSLLACCQLLKKLLICWVML